MSEIESAEMFRERLDGEIHYDVRTDSQRLGDDVVSLIQRRDAAVRQDARNGWVRLTEYLHLRDRFSSTYRDIAQLEREREAEHARAEQAYANYVQLMRDVADERNATAETVARLERERDDAIAERKKDAGALAHFLAAKQQQWFAAEAQGAELRAALEKLTWAGVGAFENTCIECYSYPDAGHEPDCWIAPILSRTPAESMARQQAVARVVEAARAVARDVLNRAYKREVPSMRHPGETETMYSATSVSVNVQLLVALSDALAALDGGVGDD